MTAVRTSEQQTTEGRRPAGGTRRLAASAHRPRRLRLRLRHQRNRQGQLWLNITSTHLVLADFVNLDPAFSPALTGVYPALDWARALRRTLRNSRTLRLLRGWATAGRQWARRPRLAAAAASAAAFVAAAVVIARRGVTRCVPRSAAVPGRQRADQSRPWAVLGQWEARRAAVIMRYRPRRRLALDDGSVDHILCAHVLQELPPHLVGPVLDEYARVLRPGGTLHVVLPDLRRAVDRYVRGDIDADELMAWQRVAGGPGAGADGRGTRWRHRPDRVVGPPNGWLYDEHTALRRLAGAGFAPAPGAAAATPSAGLVARDPVSLHLVAVRA
ncbi:methyltransferase type 11 [Parafrankia colletiae]|uniref:Methyltransferase type 11 n=1 Tax=Parafrankia colletiae TaxID=573497 RepID=A0A1S1REL7_9ACTN|nr:class I SAM-dependent methyltransferase [Parafrankia colletiae]MCK9900865.1 class I SAM-dependent methyltransferase [Frankia sp. Cpl3]OHV43274.1 methyltransferase type 11 [Parafrankia colletiae]